MADVLVVANIYQWTAWERCMVGVDVGRQGLDTHACPWVCCLREEVFIIEAFVFVGLRLVLAVA